MKYDYRDPVAQGALHLIIGEARFDRLYFSPERERFLTLAWNNGDSQIITIDEIDYEFPAQSVLPLFACQSFRLERPEQIIAWQYNRNFYCIIDHDKEISCAGFLFYGYLGPMFITLDSSEQHRIEVLLNTFTEEFRTTDTIQREMLQMLLKRLIIILTRLARQQYVKSPKLTDEKLDIIRNYNLLVEVNFRKEHQVQFYSDRLHRSPKTLANLFALYNRKSPLAIIQERILLEAKRLLIFTEKSAKEIAFELGFEDAAYFSNFFKKHYKLSPLDFRNKKTETISE
ncbi:MAG TPA: helix-turn-helix domain-containing protein [Puia sp.]|jgi:AraC-like DNA-binding protein